MSTRGDLEIFERAVASGGRLLRVEADRAGATADRLVLTFDIGRILVAADDAGLSVRIASDRALLPPGLRSLQEEEPWWRLLGHPLTAVWPGDAESGVGARGLGPSKILKLRFREEGHNPRVVALEAVGRTLAIGLAR